MRTVPIAEFVENASVFVLAAKVGEDVVITRHGEPMATLTAIDPDGGAAQHEEERDAARREEKRMVRQREALHALFEEGRIHRAKYGSVSIDEIIEWKNEGRR